MVSFRRVYKYRHFLFCLSVFVLVSIIASFLLLSSETNPNSVVVMEPNVELLFQDDEKLPGLWRNLTQDEVAALSPLGYKMYVEESIKDVNVTLEEYTVRYTILVWKHGKQLENRFFKRYGKTRHDPYEGCSVNNCDLVYADETNHSSLATADAVFIHLHKTKGLKSLPQWAGSRPAHQVWVFLTDESPYNTFMDHGSYNDVKHYDNVFNWSMSFRMDSDVPVPYGRTLRLTPDEEAANLAIDLNYAETKTAFIAVMGSNCGGSNHRWRYIKLLQKHVPVDTYGGCGTIKCPGHFHADCKALSQYKFYLSFENSNCREYITEKAWFNGYAHDSVPVIMGANQSDCAKHLPPNSYVHSADFKSEKELGEFLLALHADDERYNRYFEWKRKYKVLNEHGYFQTPVFHYCRLCQALNYNTKGRVYANFGGWRSKASDCY